MNNFAPIFVLFRNITIRPIDAVALNLLATANQAE